MTYEWINDPWLHLGPYTLGLAHTIAQTALGLAQTTLGLLRVIWLADWRSHCAYTDVCDPTYHIVVYTTSLGELWYRYSSLQTESLSSINSTKKVWMTQIQLLLSSNQSLFYIVQKFPHSGLSPDRYYLFTEVMCLWGFWPCKASPDVWIQDCITHRPCFCWWQYVHWQRTSRFFDCLMNDHVSPWLQTQCYW
jgi:hypothetical protein